MRVNDNKKQIQNNINLNLYLSEIFIIILEKKFPKCVEVKINPK